MAMHVPGIADKLNFPVINSNNMPIPLNQLSGKL